MYFITICIQSMEPRLGSIVDSSVVLNAAGEMVASIWESNAARFAGIALDDFVVMPNHLHAIIFLGADPELAEAKATLSRVVQGFKSESTVRYIEGVKSGSFPPFNRVLWQRGFYDRIIRNQDRWTAARRYIEVNPANANAELIDANPRIP